MIVILILIVCVLLPILAFGLPLLLPPDSPIPDLVGAAVLTALVLVFIWGTGAYWILLPILVVLAGVAWLERPAAEATRDVGVSDGSGMTGPTRLRFRLWRTANRLGMALPAGLLLSLATGLGAAAAPLIVPWIPITLVAAAAFRFSFYRSCRRDERLVPQLEFK